LFTHKTHQKTNGRNYFTVSNTAIESKTQAALCTANDTVCEQKVVPVSTNDVNTQ